MDDRTDVTLSFNSAIMYGYGPGMMTGPDFVNIPFLNNTIMRAIRQIIRPYHITSISVQPDNITIVVTNVTDVEAFLDRVNWDLSGDEFYFTEGELLMLPNLNFSPNNLVAFVPLLNEYSY